MNAPSVTSHYLTSLLFSLFSLLVAVGLVVALFALGFAYGPKWAGPDKGFDFPVFTLRLFEVPPICFLAGICLIAGEHFFRKSFYRTPLSDSFCFASFGFCALQLFSWFVNRGDLDLSDTSHGQNGVAIIVNGKTTLAGHLLDFHLLAMSVVAIGLCGWVYGLLRRSLHPTF